MLSDYITERAIAKKKDKMIKMTLFTLCTKFLAIFY